MRIAFISLVLCFFLSIFSCQEKNKYRQYKTFEKDGLFLKAYVINDTLFDDTVYYYNSDNILVQKEFYTNGVLDGLSEVFYANGNVKAQTLYSSGLRNGANRYYDSIGNLVYADNYYYDLSVGPVVYYDINGVPRRFFYISFDNKTFLDIDYSKWNGINEVALDFINYSYEIQQVDSVKKVSLFLYLINPPKFFTKYSLYKRNRKSDTEQVFLTDFTSTKPFTDSILPLLEENDYYSIRLEIYDSILNKKTIINREVW